MFERSRNFFDCHIAGFGFYDGLDVIDQLTLGAPVTLWAEPDNPCDPCAVAIYFGNTKLGYVPRAKNGILGNMLYFGHDAVFEARINSRNLENDPERQFRIVIRLRDNRA